MSYSLNGKWILTGRVRNLNVTNLRDFRRFLSLLALRVGQLVNYSELSKDVGVEIDFIVEKDGKIFLVEAKTSEKPNLQKLNFK